MNIKELKEPQRALLLVSGRFPFMCHSGEKEMESGKWFEFAASLSIAECVDLAKKQKERITKELMPDCDKKMNEVARTGEKTQGVYDYGYWYARKEQLIKERAALYRYIKKWENKQEGLC